MNPFDWYTELCDFLWSCLLQASAYLWDSLQSLAELVNWVLLHLLTFLANLVYALISFMGNFTLGLLTEGLNMLVTQLDPSIQQVWAMIEPYTRLISIFIPVDFCLGMFYVLVSVWVSCAPLNFINRWVKGWI